MSWWWLRSARRADASSNPCAISEVSAKWSTDLPGAQTARRTRTDEAVEKKKAPHFHPFSEIRSHKWFETPSKSFKTLPRTLKAMQNRAKIAENHGDRRPCPGGGGERSGDPLGSMIAASVGRALLAGPRDLGRDAKLVHSNGSPASHVAPRDLPK